MNGSAPPTFSLLDEPWILCSLTTGDPELISIREAFSGRPDLLGIRGDSPTQDYAVHRLLQAIYWRAHGLDIRVGPGETFNFAQWCEDAWDFAQENEPDRVVLDYLAGFEDRFDLRHPTQPFMQVADLRTSKDSRASIERIIPEAETSYFATRAGEGLEAISPAEAARWLIHCHAYDYSGIKPGAVDDPRVKGGKGYPIGTGWSGMTGGTLLLGTTLAETFVLNTPQTFLQHIASDLPPWEREHDTAAPRSGGQPNGPVDLATWQSRRIRLFWEGDQAVAVLVSNGDGIPNAGANISADPMTPYRFSSNKSKKDHPVFYPLPYDTERVLWRSLEPLLTPEGEVTGLKKGERAGKQPATVVTLSEVGADVLGSERQHIETRLISASYGSQASTAATTTDARIGFPRGLVDPRNRTARADVFDAAKAADASSVALGRFGAQLRQAAGKEYVFDAESKNALLGVLEPHFTHWLRNLSLDVNEREQQKTRWQELIARETRMQAQEMIRGAGPKALIGRMVMQGDKERFISAGAAYSFLIRELRKVLPLAYPAQDAQPDTLTIPTTEENPSEY